MNSTGASNAGPLPRTMKLEDWLAIPYGVEQICERIRVCPLDDVRKRAIARLGQSQIIDVTDAEMVEQLYHSFFDAGDFWTAVEILRAYVNGAQTYAVVVKAVEMAIAFDHNQLGSRQGEQFNKEICYKLAYYHPDTDVFERIPSLEVYLESKLSSIYPPISWEMSQGRHRYQYAEHLWTEFKRALTIVSRHSSVYVRFLPLVTFVDCMLRHQSAYPGSPFEGDSCTEETLEHHKIRTRFALKSLLAAKEELDKQPATEAVA